MKNDVNIVANEKEEFRSFLTLLCRSCLKEAKRVQVAQLTIDDGA